MCPITFFWDGFKLEKAVSICFGLIILSLLLLLLLFSRQDKGTFGRNPDVARIGTVLGKKQLTF